jgi:hypothetical protein
MTKIIAVLFLWVVLNPVTAQDFGMDYKVIPVHRKVSEILVEDPYESPLTNYVARIHSWVAGEYAPLYSEMVDCIVKETNAVAASSDFAGKLLNSTMEEVVIYKDSVGCVIRKEPGRLGFLIGCSVWENGQWKAIGEDICFSDKPADARRRIADIAASRTLPALRKYYRQATVSTDTSAFANYLQQYGNAPQRYVLSKLVKYPLVIYGETHRRKVSWNFLKKVMQDPQFAEICGTVFLELPTHAQARFNHFLDKDTLDTQLILDILGSEQIYGWQDKGMYEFIAGLWTLNRRLTHKIRIIAVDFQIPWDAIKTHENYEDYQKNKMHDRDSTMAAIIESTLKTKGDARNCLFIAGMNHARKSSPDDPVKAGTLLIERLPEGSLFSIMTHAMSGSNASTCSSQIRYGLYDYLFEQNGNIPVAFDLAGSPFGKEPFDAQWEIRYEPAAGNYEDFYDGYIFLAPLKDEEYDYTLFELFTDDFVQELKRRATITDNAMGWYDIPVEELTKEKIIDHIKIDKECRGNRRWQEFSKQ